jgi:hypothetical protein
VRASRYDGIFKLSARRLNGDGGYDPGELVEQKDVELSQAESRSLDSHLAALKFFHMQTDEDADGLDGDQWVLEGVADGKYHIIDRFCATRYDVKNRGLEPFVALCMFLIDRSTLSERPMNAGHEILPVSGDFAPFFVSEVHARGGRTLPNDWLPSIPGRWLVDRDDFGFQIHLFGVQFDAVDSLLTHVLGEPEISVTENLDGYPQRTYRQGVSGMHIQLIGKTSEIHIVGVGPK